MIALRKRPVDADKVELLISGIVRQLEARGETEIASAVLGELVMEALAKVDQVAYVRYASVYRDFRAAGDFREFLEDLPAEAPKPARS
jgi:transcriptional repressor NrdR